MSDARRFAGAPSGAGGVSPSSASPVVVAGIAAEDGPALVPFSARTLNQYVVALARPSAVWLVPSPAVDVHGPHDPESVLIW